MDKLIELVYYYNSHLDKGQIGIGLTTSVKEDGREVSFDKEKEIRKYENYIISKKYGFIERLVKNEKINWRDKIELYYNISCYDWDGGEYELIGPDFTSTEHIIMILSIQDNPIGYLCSILKE